MFASRTEWPFEPNRLTKAIEERRQKALPILDLTESNPTRCGFGYDEAQILASLGDARALRYDPDPRGLLAAREAVAGYYAARGAQIKPDQIFLTTSTSEAYSYVFRLLADAGDTVLVPSPSYPLFDFLGRLNDVELIHYPLEHDHGWQIELSSLRRAITDRTRAILLVHPNNPTGSFVKSDELDSLVDICSKKNVALIADEVFADYRIASPEKGEPPRVHTHTTENRALTFTLSGLSKISALPQMKLAWIVASGPDSLLSDALRRMEVVADTYLSVSAPLAHALPSLLATHARIQPQILERVRANLKTLDEMIGKETTVSQLDVEGGWYAILRLPATRSDEDWAIKFLREDGVLTHPGHFYDFRSEGFIVLSLLPQPQVFAQGVGAVLKRVANAS